MQKGIGEIVLKSTLCGREEFLKVVHFVYYLEQRGKRRGNSEFVFLRRDIYHVNYITKTKYGDFKGKIHYW